MRFTQIRRFPDRLLSTVHRGTAFEYRALALLTKHMSMSLTRVGGSHDGGIDLLGWWWVPCEKPCAYRAMSSVASPPPLKSFYMLALRRVTSRPADLVWSNPLHEKNNPDSVFFLSLSDPLEATTSAPEPPRRNPNSNAANRRRLRVLAQCKAEKRKMGPAYLRELEGVVYRYAALAATTPLAPAPAPASDSSLLLRDSNSTSDDQPPPPPPPPRPTTTTAAFVPAATRMAMMTPPTTAMDHHHPPVVAILVSESAFTRNCLLAAHSSPLPFLLVHLPPTSSTSTSTSTSTGDGGGSAGASAELGAIFGNPALVSARGVLGGELEIRWERGTGTGAGAGAGTSAGTPSSGGAPDAASSGDAHGGSDGRPGLWWQGRPLPSWTPDAEVTDGALLERR